MKPTLLGFRCRAAGVATALAACLLAALPATAEQPNVAPRYSLKEDQAGTGTHIRRSVVRQSVLPPKLRYAELSDEDRAKLKSLYEGMADDDEPPYPAYGLAPIYKAIAEAQQRLRLYGPLTLFVQVDAQGVGQSVTVVASPDPAMSRAASWAAVRHPYKPARCAGQPCAMQFPLRLTLVKE